MKVLLHGLNYWPELIGIGKYTGEMARWLVARGHQVRVVTTFPFYPQWRVSDGYRNGFWRSERVDGVEIYRCPVWVPARPGSWRRIAHLLSFAASSAPVVAWHGATWRPDVVVAIEPTLLAAPGSLVAAWLGGTTSWMHVQDFEIDAAFELGIMKGDRLRRLAVGSEGLLLRCFSRVSTISNAMREGLRRKGVDDAKLRLLPNWAATEDIHPLPQPSPLRAEFGFDGDTIVALYAGNMSEKQGIETLVDTARELSREPRIQFVFAGEGPARPRLQALAAGLSNIRFLPLVATDRLNQLLNVADIHLLPQRRGVTDLVMPSKVLGMMASGRAIVAGVDPTAALAQVVASCGVVVPPEDGSAMAAAIRELAADEPRRAALGAAGRQHALAEWSRDAVLGQFERWIEEARQPTGRPQRGSALLKAEARRE
jgi:colanic acid biosynthesis glycosyl transferase WcaI